MRDTYSLYEAKARLSALVRRVREGGRVVITVHGKPAAELCPVEADDTDLENRLARLAERGIVVRRTAGARRGPVAGKPGALARFLAERE
jgi:prevent-host-death family protein